MPPLYLGRRAGSVRAGRCVRAAARPSRFVGVAAPLRLPACAHICVLAVPVLIFCGHLFICPLLCPSSLSSVYECLAIPRHLECFSCIFVIVLLLLYQGPRKSPLVLVSFVVMKKHSATCSDSRRSLHWQALSGWTKCGGRSPRQGRVQAAAIGSSRSSQAATVIMALACSAVFVERDAACHGRGPGPPRRPPVGRRLRVGVPAGPTA